MCRHANVMAYTWGSKGNFQHFILSFHGIWGMNLGCLTCARSTVTCWAILLVPQLGATYYYFMTELWLNPIWLESVTCAIILALVKFIAAHFVKLLVLDVVPHPCHEDQMVFGHRSFL